MANVVGSVIQMLIDCAAKKMKLNCSVFGMMTIAKAGIVPVKDEGPTAPTCSSAEKLLHIQFFIVECLRNVFRNLILPLRSCGIIAFNCMINFLRGLCLILCVAGVYIRLELK